MNYLFLLFVAILLHGSILAQCEVDAGEDLIGCITNANQEDTIRLDGKLLSGDIVSYSWSARTLSDGRDVTNQLFRETDRLDPSIQSYFGEFLTVYLSGITSDNQTCTDSMSLIFSFWNYSFANTTRIKGPEDTIQIFGAALSDLPVSYEWFPNYNISDITVENPRVWNDTTVTYFSNIMDTLGCVETNDSFTSIVSTSSVDNESQTEYLSIYPNPTKGIFYVTFSDIGSYNYTVTSISGRHILSGTSDHLSELELDMSHLESGMYLLLLTKDEQSYVSKFLVAH